MADAPQIARRIAAEEAIGNQLRNLEDTIQKLVALAKPLQEGELRDRLFDRIRELDSIVDVIRQALDSLI